MSIPADPVEIPLRVQELVGTAALECVWRNGIGGLTFRASGSGIDRFIKWSPRHVEKPTMRDEAERMRWASRWTRVPEVLEHGEDDTHEWLVTSAIAGENAVTPRWAAAPAVAVRTVGEGLRALHDALPVSECAWEWNVDARITEAAERGIRVPDSLRTPPETDLLVVCHGDACCPNTLDDTGRWTAHVDLGALGIADRWADIAVAAMSTEWNYGPGWEHTLIEAYGLAADHKRIAYYRALWNET